MISTRSKVLLTDYPWPDLQIETDILEAAGHELVAGPSEASSAAEIEALVAAHDPIAIMTCWAQVSAQAIRRPRELRIVARMGVGLDNIDVRAASERGAWVTNVPDYCVEEVSDHAIAMLLSAWRGIVSFDRQTKRRLWNPASADLRRTKNMVVGLIGYGRIGAMTARKLSQGFGCRVLVNAPSVLRQYASGQELSPGVFAAVLEQIQCEADAIVLHLPLTESSRYLIDDRFIAQCRRKPILVNVSRGGLVDNQALIRALNSGALSAAALDVLEGEPTPPAEILSREEVIVTPHVAFSSDASLAELRQRVSEEVVRVLRGEQPLHPCNKPIRP